MNFELFFSISASRPSCNFHARTCMKAHERSPRIYGYLDYSTNSPACQLVFSINFHITFIKPRLCEVCPAEKPFFQGEFYGAGQGQNARRGRKGCRKCFFRSPFTELTDLPIRARGSGIFRLFGGGFPSLYIAGRGPKRKTRKRWPSGFILILGYSKYTCRRFGSRRTV